MRAHQTVLLAALFLITLSMIVSLISAADIQGSDPAMTMPVNDTPLSTVAAHGTGAPLSSFEKQEEITLYRFELNQTTFPGPRSMTFGPRYIQMTTSPATIIILFAGVFAVCGALFVMYRRKKAIEPGSADSEEENTEDSEKER
jgi:hypothetical protein